MAISMLPPLQGCDPLAAGFTLSRFSMGRQTLKRPARGVFLSTTSCGLQPAAEIACTPYAEASGYGNQLVAPLQGCDPLAAGFTLSRFSMGRQTLKRPAMAISMLPPLQGCDPLAAGFTLSRFSMGRQTLKRPARGIFFQPLAAGFSPQRRSLARHTLKRPAMAISLLPPLQGCDPLAAGFTLSRFSMGRQTLKRPAMAISMLPPLQGCDPLAAGLSLPCSSITR
jgi:hypothetical protein